MPRTALAFVALLLAACSSDPPAVAPADATADIPPDATQDTPAPDTGRDVTTDAASTVDVRPDVSELVDVTPDAAPDVSIDAAVEDAADAGQADVVAVDTTPADVPTDIRVTDTTSAAYDLARTYSAVETHVLYTVTCVPGMCTNEVIEAVTGASDCSVNSREVQFTVGPFVGALFLDPDAGMGRGSVSIGSRSTITPILTAGRSYAATGPRQNFRVQFALPATSSANGVSGVLGRTASTDLGELWLFGCPIR